jgi:hypothetical protein
MKWTEHPVYEVPGLARTPEGAIVATFRDGKRLMTPEQLVEFHRLREERIAQEKADPYHFGQVLPIWAMADRQFEELRGMYPRGVVELLILGGNRASKSRYFARRAIRTMIEKPGARVWCLQSTEAASIQNQQPYLWDFIPSEWKPTQTGKLRKGVVTNITYSQKGGFTENSFVFPNGSQCWFKFYSMDVASVEGAELDFAWPDEEVTPEWLEALRFRLLTRNGELGVGFTPVSGYTSAVAEYLAGAVTVEETEAELLPIFGNRTDGTDRTDKEKQRVVVGYEKVPRVQHCAKGKARVVYFHTADNPFGNYEGMRTELEGSNRERIKIRAYGVPTKKAANMFTKFSTSVHVVEPELIPKAGTNYQVVDPCSGRNWAMIWARFDAAGRCFIFDEWPSQVREVPGVGEPGAWAVPSSKNPDGIAGEAQRSFGFGLSHYKLEIENIEREHAREADGYEVFERLMDSRYGNAATVAREGATTLIEECAEVGLDFLAAPGDAIAEGVTLINDWLSYDDRKPISALNQPKLYVSSRCKNVIFALEQYTGTGGKLGGCKDFVDVVRYLVLSGAEHVEGKDLAVRPAGSY